MAASNPQGQEQFWYDGQVWPWLQNASHDAGAHQFWYDGKVAIGLMPVAPLTFDPALFQIGNTSQLVLPKETMRVIAY